MINLHWVLKSSDTGFECKEYIKISNNLHINVKFFAQTNI